jgi:hypothetical protein
LIARRDRKYLPRSGNWIRNRRQDEIHRPIETPALRAGASTTITAQPVGFSGQRDGKAGIASLDLHMHGCALHVFVTGQTIKNMWRRSNYCI